MPLRVVFLGSDVIARPLLDWLAGEGALLAHVVGVFTQPDRAVGRGQKIQPNAIKTWAESRDLPVYQPEKLSEESRAQLAALQADIGLVMAYGHILRDEFIGTPRLGMLNLHTSLLPKYRGASPIQSAIASGERVSGVTLMRIVRRLDAGPMVEAETVNIADLDTAADLEVKLAAACVPLVARNLAQLARGDLRATAQDDAKATYCRKLEKPDGALDFAAPAAVLAARVNGLFPWPSCSVEMGGQSVKLGLADVVTAPARPGGPPGAFVGVDEDGLLVATGQGLLRLRRLQRAGGKMLPAADFLRGFPISVGVVLPSQPMTTLVTTR